MASRVPELLPLPDRGGRGALVVLEGIDGSGTTTQCAALARALGARGHATHVTREPSVGPIGTLVRASLGPSGPDLTAGARALLFAADRLHHVAQEIAPALGRGANVLCDRYLLSSWAYQSLDCDLAWVRQINALAPWPDLTILLRVPAEIALERVRARARATGAPTERYDDAATQRALAERYDTLAAEGLPNLAVVDGARAPDQVTEALLALIDPILAG